MLGIEINRSGVKIPLRDPVWPIYHLYHFPNLNELMQATSSCSADQMGRAIKRPNQAKDNDPWDVSSQWGQADVLLTERFKLDNFSPLPFDDYFTTPLESPWFKFLNNKKR